MLAILVALALAAPNVIVISVDTLRADHLGMYGHAYDTSPNLDKLAEKSLVFENMVCEVPLTGPSFSSMFTGQVPRMTGVIRNGIALDEDISTVAEHFQNAGYHTVCVQSNWTLKSRLSALNRGFEIYDDDFHKRRWGFLKTERDGDEVTRLALDVLEKWDRTRPLFAWFHYSDPHAPYKMHRNFNVAKNGYNEEEGRKIRIRYDSEIAFADDQIAQLLDALPKENTYIVFVGDHGESLSEHGYVGHGRRVYQTGLHVPFMIHGPGIEPGRSASPARGVDVGPTLLGLAKLSTRLDAMGVDLLGADLPAERVRVVETYGGAVPALPGVREIMSAAPPQRQAALSGRWKLILNGDNAQLFDLSTDPAEVNDLGQLHPERVASLRAVIEEWSKQHKDLPADETELSEEDREALEALGYTN